MSEAELSKEILGRRLIEFSRADKTPGSPVEGTPVGSSTVKLRAVTGSVLRDIDIDVKSGEVVGVIGATESGHEELPYLITGAHSSRGAGSIDIAGTVRDLARLKVDQSLADGVVLVPTDRAGQGLAIGETAISNVSLPRVSEKSPHGILHADWQRQEFLDACTRLNISPPDPEQLVASFSGGNQQKLLLAKWLLQKPRFLVLHEPTQAVDVGARADILRAISAVAAGGAAVLVCSIEAEDLSLICDRIIVLDRGRVASELRRPFTPDQVQEAIG
jgi:ribose transport system ATP-binding protein